MADLYEQVGTCDYNDIFAGPAPVAHVVAVKLAASQGTLERGTVIVGVPGEEFSACSATATGDQTGYVLAEDTDTGTGAAVTAPAFSTGFFRREALRTNGTYELTPVDYDKLRGIGILTTDSVD